jgi:hypothetical protein
MPVGISSLVTGLSATKTGFDLIRSLRESLGRPDVNPGDIQARLVELQSLMLDAQRALADADEENRELRRQLDDRSRIEEFGKQFQFEEGVYWHREYPYCPNCWDTDLKPTRLDGPYANINNSAQKWNCPIHKSVYHLRGNPQRR